MTNAVKSSLKNGSSDISKPDDSNAFMQMHFRDMLDDDECDDDACMAHAVFSDEEIKYWMSMM